MARRDRPGRPSHGVFGFLRDRGYDAIPVNPALAGRPVQGVASVATLADAKPLDMVDIFRRSAEAGAVVDEAITLGARSVWMQLGVVNMEAAERAEKAGLKVVMNRCPKIEHSRLAGTIESGRGGNRHLAHVLGRHPAPGDRNGEPAVVPGRRSDRRCHR